MHPHISLSCSPQAYIWQKYCWRLCVEGYTRCVSFWELRITEVIHKAVLQCGGCSASKNSSCALSCRPKKSWTSCTG